MFQERGETIRAAAGFQLLATRTTGVTVGSSDGTMQGSDEAPCRADVAAMSALVRNVYCCFKVFLRLMFFP